MIKGRGRLTWVSRKEATAAVVAAMVLIVIVHGLFFLFVVLAILKMIGLT